MNKKKRIVFSILYLVAVVVTAFLLCLFQYRTYLKNYNAGLNALCYEITEKSGLTPAEIMEALNSEDPDTDFFAKYGIDIEKEAVSKASREAFVRFEILTVAFALLFGLLPIIFLMLSEKAEDKRIKEITKELSDINQGNYHYDLNTKSEGHLSVLEDELYKTAITLKEAAENSKKDKESLKDSLSDISHQLKTPLTSLSINLDNLYEYPDLPPEKRKEIVLHAKRETGKVNQMVQLLLKLSRFEANAIEFDRKPTEVLTLVKAAMANVEALCDLKGISVTVDEKDTDLTLDMDAYWETEAITNILKNGVEHAESFVKISLANYELYSEIVIENDGQPISDEDARNAFNRFYRGENAAEDSVGIGLALADRIVRQDKGRIIAEATGTGTRFVLRYLM